MLGLFQKPETAPAAAPTRTMRVARFSTEVMDAIARATRERDPDAMYDRAIERDLVDTLDKFASMIRLRAARR